MNSPVPPGVTANCSSPVHPSCPFRYSVFSVGSPLFLASEASDFEDTGSVTPTSPTPAARTPVTPAEDAEHDAEIESLLIDVGNLAFEVPILDSAPVGRLNNTTKGKESSTTSLSSASPRPRPLQPPKAKTIKDAEVAARGYLCQAPIIRVLTDVPKCANWWDLRDSLVKNVDVLKEQLFLKFVEGRASRSCKIKTAVVGLTTEAAAVRFDTMCLNDVYAPCMMTPVPTPPRTPLSAKTAPAFGSANGHNNNNRSVIGSPIQTTHRGGGVWGVQSPLTKLQAQFHLQGGNSPNRSNSNYNPNSYSNPNGVWGPGSAQGGGMQGQAGGGMGRNYTSASPLSRNYSSGNQVPMYTANRQQPPMHQPPMHVNMGGGGGRWQSPAQY